MPAKFKLTIVEASEGELRRSLHQALQWQMNLGKVLGFLCANGGAGRDRYGRPIPHYRLWYQDERDISAHLSDIVVFLADGTTAFVEVKRKSVKRATEGQDKLLAWMGKAHKAGVARSVEDLIRICGL